MTTQEKLIKNKLGLLELANYLENVSEACRVQADLDEWLVYYNNERTHQGKRCQGRTPLETFLANTDLAKEKLWSMSDDETKTAA